MNVFLSVLTGVLMRVLMNALISASVSALAGSLAGARLQLVTTSLSQWSQARRGLVPCRPGTSYTG